MSLDSLVPIAPARVRALLLPVGQIKRDRFASFVQRLSQEHVVHLRDISADGRPNRNKFSPLAFPDGAIFYDLVTHVPPPSHLALSPFDLYREPPVIIAIADGTELEKEPLSKRQSVNGHAPTTREQNIRFLYQELEKLRDSHGKALSHHVLIFDYVPLEDTEMPIPEGVKTIPGREVENYDNEDYNARLAQSTSQLLGPGTPEDVKSPKGLQDKVAVQGFGPGGLNERWRNKGKGRVSILIGSMYLQAGRWTDALKDLVEGTTVAKSVNDHIWHGKGLELITVCLLLLGWAGIEFQVPSICLANDKSSSNKFAEPENVIPDQPIWLRQLQQALPDLLEKIIGLYCRVSGEQLPLVSLSETVIRLSSCMTALHIREGKVDKTFLEMAVTGNFPAKPLTTSPRLSVTPSRSYIVNVLFKAFPSSLAELLTTVDRAIILSGIASVLGTLGFQRKKAMVVRELISVLISGLIEARTRGAAEVGIHPAAGLVGLDATHGQGNGSGALELGEGDIEQGVDSFLGLLCRTYGVVGYNGACAPNSSSSLSSDDSNDAVISRIQNQSAARHFGMPMVKLNILRACINFSEALPDFNGVLRPETGGCSPIIHRDEQLRLATNISKTSILSTRSGLGKLSAEYWDEFLIRDITVDPLPPTRAPEAHAKSVLPGSNIIRTSQDVNPFIYNPFLRPPNKALLDQTLVVGEAAVFRITIQNPYEMDLDIESIKLDTEGAACEPAAESTIIGPYRTQISKVTGIPREAGDLKVTGAVVRVRGCRERRFPIFTQPWAADTQVKVKGFGVTALEKNKELPNPGPALTPTSMSLTAISAQPVVVVKSTSLAQSAVMILEGERQDSTQGPLQTAILNRDATPAELYEYELVLAKRQALRRRKVDEAQRYIAPGETKTFDFEILGKPGLTNGTIQIDYAYLGVPQDEIKDQFHTRQVCLDLAPLWKSIGVERTETDAPIDSDKYCLLMMDLRNAWPSNMEVRLEAANFFAIKEHILPGHINRIVFPVPRVYLEDPHAFIPAINPSRQRQFVVSTSKISPETERANREAFWFREKVIDSLKASWKTLSGPPRAGAVELRGMRLTPRQIEAVKIDEVGIELSVEPIASGSTTSPESSNDSSSASESFISVDDFVQIRVRLTNRTLQPIYPTLRLMPALAHRPLNVALDFTRKFAWNGTLQQTLPLLDAHATTEVCIGATALCRGEFELMASVEETRLWGRRGTGGQEHGKRGPAEVRHAGHDGCTARRQGTEGCGTQGISAWYGQAPEGLAIHTDCFDLFLKECQTEDALDRLWAAAVSRSPWRGAPHLHLGRDTVFDMKLVCAKAEAYGIPCMKLLPPELVQVIYTYSSLATFWRYIAIVSLARELRAAAPMDSGLIPLRDVAAWTGDRAVIPSPVTAKTPIQHTSDHRWSRHQAG
ncbi:hypothetical protein PG994_008806 [Apiospora phragmitis]|uniref:Hypercellular protein HypA n=1 Tax=Apiospora phragmitis TaxID=2905665 RepID=A0ABR1UHI8_9PEZI